jgi:hypothetical protein
MCLSCTAHIFRNITHEYCDQTQLYHWDVIGLDHPRQAFWITFHALGDGGQPDIDDRAVNEDEDAGGKHQRRMRLACFPGSGLGGAEIISGGTRFEPMNDLRSYTLVAYGGIFLGPC